MAQAVKQYQFDRICEQMGREFGTIRKGGLVKALLMSFDPFTNEKIKEVVEENNMFDLSDKEQLRLFYQEPVMCILRIRASVDFWEKRMGADGYFGFIEQSIGSSVPRDEKMNYTIYAGRET